jgi:hypothetical protein
MFKSGDKVVCVENGGAEMFVAREGLYEVVKYPVGLDWRNKPLIALLDVNVHLSADRFKLAT